MKDPGGATVLFHLTINMMNINFFKPGTPYYPFRWFFIITIVLTGWLIYANMTGWRIMSSSSQQQWKARGSGYHK
jgi:hypothetical protein